MTSPEPEMTGSHRTGTGSDLNRKSRGLGWKTAEQSEKSIVGAREGKTAEKKRAQSPKSNFGSGGTP